MIPIPTLHIAKSEEDLMKQSKNFMTRARLDRDIEFTEDFRKRFMTNEYGNYEKYEKNQVDTKYDRGL